MQRSLLNSKEEDNVFKRVNYFVHCINQVHKNGFPELLAISHSHNVFFSHMFSMCLWADVSVTNSLFFFLCEVFSVVLG